MVKEIKTVDDAVQLYSDNIDFFTLYFTFEGKKELRRSILQYGKKTTDLSSEERNIAKAMLEVNYKFNQLLSNELLNNIPIDDRNPSDNFKAARFQEEFKNALMGKYGITTGDTANFKWFLKQYPIVFEFIKENATDLEKAAQFWYDNHEEDFNKKYVAEVRRRYPKELTYIMAKLDSLDTKLHHMEFKKIGDPILKLAKAHPEISKEEFADYTRALQAFVKSSLSPTNFMEKINDFDFIDRLKRSAKVIVKLESFEVQDAIKDVQLKSLIQEKVRALRGDNKADLLKDEVMKISKIILADLEGKILESISSSPISIDETDSQYHNKLVSLTTDMIYDYFYENKEYEQLIATYIQDKQQAVNREDKNKKLASTETPSPAFFNDHSSKKIQPTQNISNPNINEFIAVFDKWKNENKYSPYLSSVESFIQKIVNASRHSNAEKVIVEEYKLFTSVTPLHRLHGIDVQKCQFSLDNMKNSIKNQYRRPGG